MTESKSTPVRQIKYGPKQQRRINRFSAAHSNKPEWYIDSIHHIKDPKAIEDFFLQLAAAPRSYNPEVLARIIINHQESELYIRELLKTSKNDFNKAKTILEIYKILEPSHQLFNLVEFKVGAYASIYLELITSTPERTINDTEYVDICHRALEEILAKGRKDNIPTEHSQIQINMGRVAPSLES